MGRLNYTNRKIEGLKLGHVVNKDLVKRIPPNAGYKAAFRDPAVDLDVSGKALTDEGFFEVASALIEALAYDGVQGRCARMEELCLRDNKLTVASLQALAPVIRLACRDLRDLDLSNNMIAVSTEDEVAIWESFLTSFQKCCTLRRIDLSGNALGTRAFEVLLRVYANEEPINLELPRSLDETQDGVRPGSTAQGDLGHNARNSSKIFDHESCSDEDVSPRSHQRRGSRQDSKSPEKACATMAKADLLPLYATTQGLRSVPYLVLCDTSMTETCALHLSYIVENHHTPQQLLARVPPVKSGPLAQQLAAYDNDLHGRGIVYHPNSKLGNTGMKVLELAETRREAHLGDANAFKLPLSKNLPTSVQSPRRLSGVSSLVSGAKWKQYTHKGSLDQGEERADLERARSRIQGNALQEAGALSNELWQAALKLLVLGRNIQFPKRKNHPLPGSPTVPASSEAPQSKGKGPIIKTLTIPGYVKPQPLKSLPITKPLAPVKSFPPLDPFPPLKPLTGKDPNQPLNPWGNTLRKKRETTPSKPSVADPKAEPEITKAAIEGSKPLQTARMYRTELPCGFSEDAWRRILGHFAGVKGILSADQQLSVLQYAMDRRTLSKESEVLGLTVATQVWRILEATGCLTYEMDI